MKRLFTACSLAFGVVVASVALAVPASAVTIDVFPGESIQAAVHAAVPGDTIVVHAGTYNESVSIHKDDITIQGEGGLETGTVLMPPTASTRVCGHGSYGFCVFSHAGTVTGVHISGFRVEGFPVFGILGFGTAGLMIENNTLVNDGEYGAAAFSTTHTSMIGNTSTGNSIGLYIGDSPHAHAELAGNDVFGNHGFGIFLRSAAVGEVHDNSIHGNCSGIFMLNEGTITPHDWQIHDNDISKNNAFCPADEQGSPPLSGVGIILIGADHNTIRGNVFTRNRPSDAVPFSGGVVLVSPPDPPGLHPDGNRIVHNTFTSNKPQVFSDGTGHRNIVRHNQCSPAC
jgi:nitrous oxidase accessory protein NosD